MVNNDGDEDYGSSVDMLTATAKSINTAFVDVTQTIGPQRVVDAAIAAGVPRDPKDLVPVPVVTLGVSSETPLTMANAFGTFAAEGERATPHFVQQVTSRGGRTVYEPEDKTTRAFDADITADVTYALQQVVDHGTGTKAQSVGRPVAGKTGTHEDQTAWFVGYTPQLSVAVGTYREDSKGKRQSLDGVDGQSAIFGADYPLDIWSAFMKSAMEGKKVVDFPEPANVGESNAPNTHPGAGDQEPGGHPDADRGADSDTDTRADGGAVTDRPSRHRPPSRRTSLSRPRRPRPRPRRSRICSRRPDWHDGPVTDARAPAPPSATDPFVRRMSGWLGGPTGRFARLSANSKAPMIAHDPGGHGDLGPGDLAEVQLLRDGLGPRRRPPPTGRTTTSSPTPVTPTSPCCIANAGSRSVRCPTSTRARATPRWSTRFSPAWSCTSWRR